MPSGRRTTSPTRPRAASGSTTWCSPRSVSAASARRHAKRLGRGAACCAPTRRSSAVLAHHNQHGDPPHEGQECHRHADPRVLDEPDVYAPGLGALGHYKFRNRPIEGKVPREGEAHGREPPPSHAITATPNSTSALRTRGRSSVTGTVSSRSRNGSRSSARYAHRR